MNAGWEEWVAAALPTHAASSVSGYQCSCSDKI